MYRLLRPNENTISTYLSTCSDLPLSYSAVGSTLSNTMPSGWLVNHNEVGLGYGDDVWHVAKSSIAAFSMFDIDWVELVPSHAKMIKGEIVATMARIVGVWTLNPCRIIDVVDENNRYGFAYGTLEPHAMRGEERFLILRNPETGEIRFDITSFSKPRDWVSWITLPMVRSIQRRFVVASGLAMVADVQRRQNKPHYQASTSTVASTL